MYPPDAYKLASPPRYECDGPDDTETPMPVHPIAALRDLLAVFIRMGDAGQSVPMAEIVRVREQAEQVIAESVKH